MRHSKVPQDMELRFSLTYIMVELKIVYRTLRTISDWTLSGYYNEVLVQGKENVPKEGPVIIASTHHNEIIDVAALAATISHRRHLAFWAKASLFKSLVGGPILSSSGAIPVKRNPNRGANTPETTTLSHSELYASTCHALSRGEAIGVFAEGASYTRPGIVQIMSGAAWAAVEYIKWERERAHTSRKDRGISRNAEGLVIIPVAVVYTDKSQYLSRILVHYGDPIRVIEYTEGISSAHEAEIDERTAVKNIMGKVEERLFAMTVNANNWETLYAAQTARDILFRDPKTIPLQHWTKISQTLIRLLTETSSSPPQLLENTKSMLNRYSALLHRTSLTHSLVEDLFPLPFSIASSPSGYPTRMYHIKVLARRFLNPTFLVSLPFKLVSFCIFLPALITHIPAYISSRLVAKLLSVPGEVEGIAQYAAVGGGIGFSIGWIAGSGSWASRCISFALSALERFEFTENWKSWLGQSLITLLLRNVHRLTSFVSAYNTFSKPIPGSQLLGNIIFGWTMIKLHGLFIPVYHRRYKLLLTTYRLHYFSTLLKPSSWIPPARLDVEQYYQLPPPPPMNALIKRKEQTVEKPKTTVPPIPTRRLMAHLLDAREKAKSALLNYLNCLEGSEEEADVVEWLRVMGAKTS
ncbi:hypothetical protein L218DRAFT_1073776 [Marasmius fiardii PR-910]|nr:hypothetical protein L218DRAFT_1073776 [Marasmius fiardii PR-910]